MKDRISTLFFLAASMQYCTESSQIQPSGEITEVIVDHVVDKREGCRVSRLYLVIKIYNKSSSKFEMILPSIDDHCQFENDSTGIDLLFQNTKMSLLAVEEDSLVKLGPESSDAICLIGASSLRGTSLKSIHDLLMPLLNMPFKVRLFDGEDVYEFPNSNSLKITLLLDDQVVTEKDSVKYNKSLGIPMIYDSSRNLEPDIEMEPELRVDTPSH